MSTQDFDKELIGEICMNLSDIIIRFMLEDERVNSSSIAMSTAYAVLVRTIAITANGDKEKAKEYLGLLLQELEEGVTAACDDVVEIMQKQAMEEKEKRDTTH